MRITRIRALQMRIAPGLASVHMGRSVQHSYMHSSEAAGVAP